MSNPKRSAFDRAAGAPPAPAATTAADGSGNREAQRKYTLRLDVADADQSDELVLRARKIAGRRVDKNGLIRALLDLCANDPELLDRVLDHPATQ